jgi:phenylpyruvate tautomerase PptA (4-oxalocrotonate tautomerase family)
MPMLELFYSGEEPLEREAKADFARDAAQACGEILGTPPGRLRILVRELPAEDTIEGLLDGD